MNAQPRGPYRRIRPLCLLVAGALLAGACDCGDTRGVSRTFGELGVVWRDAEAHRVVSRDALYDFGQAFVGDRKPLRLVIENTGTGKVTLASLALVDGSLTDLDADGPDTGEFEVRFRPTPLHPGSSVEFPMFFTPRSGEPSARSVLRLSAEGTRPEDANATITLLGQAVRGTCDVPPVVDFGKVPVGETQRAPALVLRNTAAVTSPGNVEAPIGPDALAFGSTADSPSGAFEVAGGSRAELAFTFSPTERRPYMATVRLRPPGGCEPRDIKVKGEGVDAVLRWQPSELDFGVVRPGLEEVREVAFQNDANFDITLGDLTSSMPTDFTRVVPAGDDASTVLVPAGSGGTRVRVACSPSGLGRREAVLSFSTPFTKSPVGSIRLVCVGGGPQIRVSPRPSVAFGRVPFVLGLAAGGTTRRVLVENVGSRGPLGAANENLHLGRLASDQAPPAEPPLFEIRPTDSATSPDEFRVSLASPYDPATGIGPVAGKNGVQLAVQLAPSSPGLKEAELIIHSSDPLEPEVRLALSAEAYAQPPCRYTVTPSALSFGLVSSVTPKELTVTVTNSGFGADASCVVRNVALEGSSDTAFSLVGGPIDERTLAPGESLRLVVRVSPLGSVPSTTRALTGAIAFDATSSAAPRGRIQLSAALGPSCLTVAPEPLDFGSVKVGCNSLTRAVGIYNECATPVTLTGFAMQAPGGSRPGGSPEFHLVQTPTLAGGGVAIPPGGTPVTLQVRYAPLDVGADEGAVAVTAVHGGVPVTSLVPLRGRGDGQGIQTDTFVQDPRPMADILLVIDDSGSMKDEQENLARNFRSFIEYAVRAGVDYHLAVVTTTMKDCAYQSCKPTASNGVMHRPAVGGARLDPVLTPNSPNVEAVFGALVRVGIEGDGDEWALDAAIAALTPPLIVNENAGFLRADANLAVIVVSDAISQGRFQKAEALNRLLNIKGHHRPSAFTFSNIGPYRAPGAAGCEYDPSYTPNTPNALFEQLVAATGGVKEEICTSDWAKALENVGRTSFGYRTQFYLNNPPDPQNPTVTVVVDGRPVPPGPTTWRYDGTTNAIVFEPDAAPTAGQTLETRYANACY